MPNIAVSGRVLFQEKMLRVKLLPGQLVTRPSCCELLAFQQKFSSALAVFAPSTILLVKFTFEPPLMITAPFEEPSKMFPWMCAPEYAPSRYTAQVTPVMSVSLQTNAFQRPIIRLRRPK